MQSRHSFFQQQNHSIGNPSYNPLKLYHGTLNIATEFF